MLTSHHAASLIIATLALVPAATCLAQVPTYNIYGMGPLVTSPEPISEVVYNGDYAGTSALMLSANHFRAFNSASAYRERVSNGSGGFEIVSQGDPGLAPQMQSLGDRLFFSGSGDTRVRLSYTWTMSTFLDSSVPFTFSEGSNTRISAGGFIDFQLRDENQQIVPGSRHFIQFGRTERLDGQVDNFFGTDNGAPTDDPFELVIEFDLFTGYSIDLSFELTQSANAFAELATRGGVPNSGNQTAVSGTSNLVIKVENIGATPGALLGYGQYDYALTAIPEPASTAVYVGALAMVCGAFSRRRRR